MTCSTNSYGIEVRFPENWHQDNPRCEHGPMLLFEKYTKGKAGKRFYACSACRDRKDCNAFIYENDYKRARLVSMSKERSHLQHIRATYEEIVECDKSERCFCVTCQMIVILKKPIAKDHSCRDHKLRRGITEKDVLYASRLLFAPLEHNSKNAQYFLNGDCTEFLLSTLVKLRFSKVLCIGMPTLHENIQALKPSQDRCKIDSLLLDIDSRFAQSNPAEAFCHFNMFNHHIFDDSLTHLKAFLSGVETSKLAVVLDPPFGGLVDAIAEIKENIVYSTSRDTMVGFTDLGESRNEQGLDPAPATHALQVYARGLATTFSIPLAYYATKSVKSHQLSSVFWECVGGLDECGFRVVAFVCDGLSANRKMFYELNNLNLEYPIKCQNMFSPDHDIFLIFDAPHLLKTVRNNVFASKPSGSRLLKLDGKHILWQHFTEVPKLFTTTELRCSKLTDAHFSMQTYAKMRVIYAAQLLSRSVAQLMWARGGTEMEASAWFAETFNKWFDIMNTTSNFGTNPDLRPYYTTDDARLHWLEHHFLPQLRFWKSSCVGATEAEKAKQFLSWQTYHGLETTTAAIVAFVRTALPLLPNGGFIVTRRLNQDPLEAFFGNIRRSGGTCENPDLERYGHLQRLVGMSKSLKWRKGSNVQQDPEEPMPKRRNK